MEDSGLLLRPVYMTKPALLVTTLAFAVLLLALAGWLVQAVRWPPRRLAAAAAR